MVLPSVSTVVRPSINCSREQNTVGDNSVGAIRIVTLLEDQYVSFCISEVSLPIIWDQGYFLPASMKLPR